MTANLARRPTKPKDLIHRKLGDEIMAVNLNNKFFYNLDSLGSFIWERCDGRHSVAQIAEAITEEYEVEPEVAIQDCEQFIQELVQEGMLEWASSPEANAQD